MSVPSVEIRLNRDQPVYHPGEVLSGTYRPRHVVGDQVQASEASVLWYTEGKGDEDMGVHAFWRNSVEAGDWIDPVRPTPFQTTLPPSPLSYEGQIITIRWCLRVRLFLYGGKDVLQQYDFRLVSPGRAANKQPATPDE